MKKLAIIALVFASTLFLEDKSAQAATVTADVHWGYSGDDGPDHWGSLSPDYATCAAGLEQSPVDIPAAAPLNTTGLTFQYQPSNLSIMNNGHTIQVNYDKGSTIALDGTTYALAQFHFHAPSEHTLAGQTAPMEMHFVHATADGKLAVVGVMIQSGAANPAFDAVLSNLPAEAGPAQEIAGAQVDAAALLPTDHTYYRYNGSLTTPPCSEGVKWLVMRAPITLSAAQIAAFTRLYPNDARPLQPLNNRTFLGSTAAPGMPTTGNGAFPALLLIAVALAGLASIAAGWAFKRRRV